MVLGGGEIAWAARGRVFCARCFGGAGQPASAGFCKNFGRRDGQGTAPMADSACSRVADGWCRRADQALHRRGQVAA